MMGCFPAGSEVPEACLGAVTRGRWTRARRSLGAILALGLSACAAQTDSQASDSAAPDSLVAERVAVIGSVGGAEPYVFGDITSVAIGPLGHVYVADRLGSSVRAYTLDGEYVATVGTEGNGPGEFNWPADLTFDPHGRLYVRDAQRITLFGRRQPDSVADSVIRTIPLPGYGNLSSTRSWTDGHRYYYPDGRYRPAHFFYVVFDSTGLTGDTVHVPPLPNLEFRGTAFYRLGATDGRMLQGVSRAPFEPVASWAVTPDGSILASPGDEYEVLKVSSTGDTMRVVRLPDRPRAVPTTELRDSTRAFLARLDSIPVDLEQVVGMSPRARGKEIPATLPAVLAVHAVGDETWLRRWPAADRPGHSFFDVLDAEGRLVGTVLVPAELLQDPPPSLRPGLIAGVVRDSATDVEMVAVFRVGAG